MRWQGPSYETRKGARAARTGRWPCDPGYRNLYGNGGWLCGGDDQARGSRFLRIRTAGPPGGVIPKAKYRFCFCAWGRPLSVSRPVTCLRAHFHWPAELGSSAGELHFFTQFRSSAIATSSAVPQSVRSAMAPMPPEHLRLPCACACACALHLRLRLLHLLHLQLADSCCPRLRSGPRRGPTAPGAARAPPRPRLRGREGRVRGREGRVRGRAQRRSAGDLRSLPAPAAKPLARPAQSTPRQGAADAGAEGGD